MDTQNGASLAEMLVYTEIENFSKELEEGCKNSGFTFEICESPLQLILRAIELRPRALILYLKINDRWSSAGVSALRKLCPESRIIFATQHPNMEDAQSVEQGIFYYAGNASSDEILEAAKIALKKSKDKEV